MASKILEIDDLKREFVMGSETVRALKGVSFTVEAGEFVTIMGSSGSGKTTLLNIIGTLDVPSDGEVVVLGKSVGKLTPKEAAQLRKEELGFIFQNYNLLPVYTVFENVEFPLLLLNMNSELQSRDNRHG